MQPKTISHTIRAAITEEAYRAHIRLVIYVLRQYRLSNSDVEEIAQDVYFSFFQNIGKITPGKEKAWLVACARNAALTNLRRDKRRNLHLVPDLDISHADTAPTAQESDRSERLHRIQMGLEQASDAKLGVLVDHYLNAQPVKAIASARGMKVSSVTSALHRQRKRFAEMISGPDLSSNL